jgi:hypothetical protein
MLSLTPSLTLCLAVILYKSSLRLFNTIKMNFCSICSKELKKDDKIIFPCKCKFPVHKHCLFNLRKVTESNICSSCKTKYILDNGKTPEFALKVELESKKLMTLHNNFKRKYMDVFNSFYMTTIQDQQFLDTHIQCVDTFTLKIVDISKNILKDLEYLEDILYDKYIDLILFVVQELKEYLEAIQKLPFFISLKSSLIENYYMLFYIKYLKIL